MAFIDCLASKRPIHEVVDRLLGVLPGYARKEEVAADLQAGSLTEWFVWQNNGEKTYAVLDHLPELAAMGLVETAIVEGFTDGKCGHPNIAPDYWEELLSMCDREKLRSATDPMPGPGPFVVYRGAAGPRGSRHARGLSWTSNLDLACWFARRWKQLNDPAVYTATIESDEVYFFTEGRNESEFVVRPRKVKRLRLAEDEMVARATRAMPAINALMRSSPQQALS